MSLHFLPNFPDLARNTALGEIPRFGGGIPGYTPGNWRKYLMNEGVPPIEALNDLAATLYSEAIDPRTLSLDEVTEGVRRALYIQNPDRHVDSHEFATEAECRDIAQRLLKDAGLMRADAYVHTHAMALVLHYALSVLPCCAGVAHLGSKPAERAPSARHQRLCTK